MRSARIVNRIVGELLANGDLPGVTAPTNHPDGWPAYAAIFRTLSDLVPDGPEPFAMLLPEN